MRYGQAVDPDPMCGTSTHLGEPEAEVQAQVAGHKAPSVLQIQMTSDKASRRIGPVSVTCSASPRQKVTALSPIFDARCGAASRPGDSSFVWPRGLTGPAAAMMQNCWTLEVVADPL